MTAAWFDARAALPGLRGVAVHVLLASREEEARRVLGAARFTIHVIEGEAVSGDASFFEQAARAFSWPTHFGRNWDAVQDLLGGLAEGRERRVALLWRDAGRSFDRDAQTVVDAWTTLARAADDLAAEDPPTQLEVFLVGPFIPLTGNRCQE